MVAHTQQGVKREGVGGEGAYYGDYYGGYGDEQKPDGKPPGGEGPKDGD